MDKKEILIILSSIRNIATSENDESKLILNQNETMELYDYLLKLKEAHDNDKELINNIEIMIEKWRSN